MNQHPPAVTWPAYLDGVLEPSQQREIERHLADCPVCRAELEAQRALRGRLEHLVADTSAYASSAVTERAWATVRPRFSARRNTFFHPLGRLAFGLGATALLAFFVLSLWALFVQQAGPLRTGEQPPLGAPLPSPTLASTAAFTLSVNQNVSYDTAYQAEAGDLVPVLFTIELSNNGPDLAARVRLTATLPALLTYLERAADGDALYDAAAHMVTWDGSLAPGATHTISFACGVPQSVGGAGTTATNRVTVDDGVHALLTDTLTVNFTPWPTIVPTPGPPPTRTPWITPTPPVLPATPTPWFTPTPSAPPTATPTPWFTPTPGLPPPTPTPWLTPTPGPLSTPTVTPPVPPPPTLPATPTPWFTPTSGPASATPTPGATSTATTRPSAPPPTLSATSTPWFTPTPVPPPPTPTSPPPPTPLPSPTNLSPPPATPTPWPTPTPPPS